VLKDETMSQLIPDLKKNIEDFQTKVFPNIPKEVIEPLMAGVDELVLSGIDRQALRRGAKAPDFELPNPAGESVRLSRLLESGPVVVSFYRGVW
jgi:hypothetical protein